VVLEEHAARKKISKKLKTKEGALMHIDLPTGINPTVLLGIALIVLGIVAFAYQGITYTTREKVIDLGPIQASVDTKKTLPLPPILGGLVLAGGIVLVMAGAKKS
jgi:uncharacterized membrane protein